MGVSHACIHPLLPPSRPLRTRLPARSSLEWVIGEQGPRDPVVALVARRLQSRLPSFTEQFTQSVPLTRIRDIAHRCVRGRRRGGPACRAPLPLLGETCD